MTTNRAYLVVPKLIEQPTWGGYYIMKFKEWAKHPAAKKKIGQSFELSGTSNLSLAVDTAHKDFQPEFDAIPGSAFPIEELLVQNGVGLLGTRTATVFD